MKLLEASNRVGVTGRMAVAQVLRLVLEVVEVGTRGQRQGRHTNSFPVAPDVRVCRQKGEFVRNETRSLRVDFCPFRGRGASLDAGRILPRHRVTRGVCAPPGRWTMGECR